MTNEITLKCGVDKSMIRGGVGNSQALKRMTAWEFIKLGVDKLL